MPNPGAKPLHTLRVEVVREGAMKLSVIIPVYNELHTLREIVKRVCDVNVPKEIILVDDYSTDGTRGIYPELEQYVDHIVLHDRNMGKGAAIRTGVQYVTGDYVVVQDADLEYDPEEYHLLLEPVLQGRADVVYGSRFLGGRPHRVLYFWHMVGNKLLTLLSNMFTNLTLTDMETCYKLVRTDIMKRIHIEQNRFGFEPEITAKLASMDIRFYEVGISYAGRSYAEGKKIGWKDGFKALWCILKYSQGRYHDVGKETLKHLESFDEYSEWICRRVRSYFGRRIMEIGSGIGNNAGFLSKDAKTELLLTDCREDYVEMLQNKFQSDERIKVLQYDATSPPPDVIVSNPPDTIVCLNVLEHIRDDKSALGNLFQALAPGGRLIILVPALQSLYCSLDKNLEHCRRYSQTELEVKFRNTGFRRIQSFYFNPVGAIGWFFAGKIMRAKRISSRHIWGQKVLLPISQALDCLSLPFGLSVVCVGEKPN